MRRYVIWRGVSEAGRPGAPGSTRVPGPGRTQSAACASRRGPIPCAAPQASPRPLPCAAGPPRRRPPPIAPPWTSPRRRGTRAPPGPPGSRPRRRGTGRAAGTCPRSRARGPHPARAQKTRCSPSLRSSRLAPPTPPPSLGSSGPAARRQTAQTSCPGGKTLGAGLPRRGGPSPPGHPALRSRQSACGGRAGPGARGQAARVRQDACARGQAAAERWSKSGESATSSSHVFALSHSPSLPVSQPLALSR